MSWSLDGTEKTHMFYKNKIIDKTTADKISSSCPICGYLARDLNDIESIKEEGACTECCMNFKHSTGEAWESGQRPTEKVARSRMSILIEEV